MRLAYECMHGVIALDVSLMSKFLRIRSHRPLNSRARRAVLPSVACVCAVLVAACAHVPAADYAVVRRDAYLRSQVELPSAIARAIAEGHVITGMNRQQVTAVLGKPVKVTRFVRDQRVTEVWIYPAARLHQGTLRVDDGSLFRLVITDDRLLVIEPF